MVIAENMTIMVRSCIATKDTATTARAVIATVVICQVTAPDPQTA